MNVWNVAWMTSRFTAIPRIISSSSSSLRSSFHIFLLFLHISSCPCPNEFSNLSFTINYSSSFPSSPYLLSIFYLDGNNLSFCSTLYWYVFIKPGVRLKRSLTQNGVSKNDYLIFTKPSLLFPHFAVQPRPEETTIITVWSRFNAWGSPFCSKWETTSGWWIGYCVEKA